MSLLYKCPGLLALALVGACQSNDDPASFVSIDPTAHNRLIEQAAAAGEAWAGDPLLIAAHLFQMADGARQTRITSTRLAAAHVVLTITHEGLYDDSVYGIHRVIDFNRAQDGWAITGIRQGVRCQQNRGHGYYAGKLCL